MNEIILALLAMIVLWSVVWWVIKKEHSGVYKEILITYSFGTLKKGKIAVFKSGERIEVGDFVMICLPGYEMVWKVVKQDGEKLELVDRNNEVLIGFPGCHIWGKMIGYKGEEPETC